VRIVRPPGKKAEVRKQLADLFSAVMALVERQPKAEAIERISAANFTENSTTLFTTRAATSHGRRPRSALK
jgi:hypothetical protein